MDVGAVRVRVTHAEHAAGRRVGTGRTQPVGYVISGTRTVYFAGDTDLFQGMGDLGRIDVALLPVAGWGPRLPPGHLDPCAPWKRSSSSDRASRSRFTGARMRRGVRRAGDDTPAKAFAELAATVVPAVDVRVLRPGQSCPLDYRPTQAAVSALGATRSTGTP